jgi:hypothetical protein
MVVIAISENLEGPGFEVRPGTKRFARFPSLAEGVLQYVLGKRRVAAQGARKSAHERQQQEQASAKLLIGISGFLRGAFRDVCIGVIDKDFSHVRPSATKPVAGVLAVSYRKTTLRIRGHGFVVTIGPKPNSSLGSPL